VLSAGRLDPPPPIHEVRAGESLWSISRLYGVDVRALARWNSMAPGDVLSVGRQLTVWTPQPTDTPAVTTLAAAPTIAAAAAPTAATQLTLTTGANDQVRQVTYVVRRGDSLSSIARRFRVTVPKLVEWNDVSIQRYLQPGQRLVMFINVLEQSG
jgi:membrane-bound lytic murein transglycosylase D